MSSTTWIEEQPARSPVRTPPGPRKPTVSRDTAGSTDAFSNISNGQGSVGSGRSGVRRFGDIFRNRLRMAGAAAMRTFNESFPQECKMHSDEESSVQTPSPKTGGKGRRAFGELVDAVLVNERAVAGAQSRRDRTFTERSNTLAGVSAGGNAGGLRSRRSSTMFRQRTVHRTSNSGHPNSYRSFTSKAAKKGFSKPALH
ncbi:AGAP006822-PA-like protein [Anopheles sinensis]|uniref:AGAP006822-PA-like protein n=1 Tax=Anopheles sinensis TaxID=74873 RepID=A0A084WMT5_ANOSI|nr:AGAP006822-PA-like protein [Anopheles sinensis]